MMDEKMEAVKQALKAAERVAILTGAGISAESGVPTFRGNDGLWKNYRATDLATPEAFARDPELVWEFYNWRRELVAKVSPNPAHKALVELEKRAPGFTLITQNVDGLHALAGSQKVLELHGCLWKVRCTGCRRVREDRSPELGNSPVCPSCGSPLRPHVVWFGESLDPEILQGAAEASRHAQVMLVVGTSAIVQPAASLALEAKSHGALVAEFSLESTPNTRFMDVSVQGRAGDIVPRLLEDWQ
jgi:NAD-dependent deacetylase